MTCMPSRIVDGYEMNVAHRGSRFTLVEKSAGRPRTACYRCSALKVRCTGERPSCHRCTRLHRRCIWTKDDSGLSRRDDASLSPGSREANKAIDESTSGTFGIPSSLLPKLVDLYFAHVDNASLLLHRPSFVQSLSTGSVTKHVVLSVCALAACFYDNGNQYNTLLDEGFARGWAEEAGRLAFSQVENPTEDNLVTFLNLTLFWYSQGQWQRMIVYEGNAACTSRVLGLGTSQSLAQNPSFSAELSRRRFWACFLINQFGNEAARCPKMNLADFEGIMLPCNEEDFEQEKFPPRHMHPGNREHQHRESYFAELIRLVSIWTSACQIAQDDRTDIHIKLLHIQELDKKLATWRAELSETFDLDTLNSPSPRSTARAISLNILYHQIMSVLHSSIVPLFSLNPVAAEACGYFQTASAQTALVHARQISSIFLRWGFSSLPQAPVSVGFIGYAAYCSCAIQLPFLWCTKSTVSEAAHANIKANLKTMRSMSKHWKLIAALTEFVPLLYNYHKNMAYSLADEPRALSEHELNRHRGVRSRAKVSILGHNGIIWNKGKVIDPGEAPGLDLDVTEKEGDEQVQSGKATTDSIHPGHGDQSCSSGSLGGHDGDSELLSDNVDSRLVTPAMLDAIAAYQEGLCFLPQTHFPVFDTTLYCTTDTYGFQNMFGQDHEGL